MREVSLFTDWFMILSVAIALGVDAANKIPKHKRCIIIAAAFLSATLFATISTGTLYIAYGHKWTPMCEVHCITLLLNALSFLLRLCDLYRVKRTWNIRKKEDSTQNAE